MAICGQTLWPSAGYSMAIYGQFFMAANIGGLPRLTLTNSSGQSVFRQAAVPGGRRPRRLSSTRPPSQRLPAIPDEPGPKPGSRGARIDAKSRARCFSSTRTSRTEFCPTPLRAPKLSMPPIFTGLMALTLSRVTSSPPLSIAGRRSLTALQNSCRGWKITWFFSARRAGQRRR